MLLPLNELGDGGPERQAAYNAYRRRVRLASVAIVFGLALVLAVSALLPTTQAQERVGLLFTAGLIVLSGFSWFVLVPRGWLPELRIFLAAAVAQAVMLVMLEVTGGVGTRYFVYYLFPILVLIFSGSVRQTIVLGTFAAVGIVGLAGATPGGVTGAIRDIAVTRIFQVATITFFAAVTANATGATRRALASRTEVLASEREQAFRMAVTDELTGLYNRHFLREELMRQTARATRHGRPFAIVTFDVDGLKRVNDTSGHQAGDELLRAVADVLRATLRAEDIPVRVGGDEFVAVLPEADRAQAVQAVHRVRQRVGAVAPDGQPASVSAGIGVWQRGMDVEELLRQADEELYRAKAARADVPGGHDRA